jgi:hypothetical protein
MMELALQQERCQTAKQSQVQNVFTRKAVCMLRQVRAG